MKYERISIIIPIGVVINGIIHTIGLSVFFAGFIDGFVPYDGGGGFNVLPVGGIGLGNDIEDGDK